MSRYRTLISGGPSIDADAKAFLTATMITDATITAAVDYLFAELKNRNLYAKLKYLYPFVGGTPFTHKFNAIDPRDNDGAFRLVFNGGWTHNTSGVLPNGVNAYAETYFSAAANLTMGNEHLAIYLNSNFTQVPFSSAYIGAYNGASQCSYLVRQSGQLFPQMNADTGGSFTNPNVSGNYLFTNNGTGNTVLYRNGVNVFQKATSGILTTNTDHIGGVMISPSLYYYSMQQIVCAHRGQGLTAQNAADMHTILFSFNQKLGRV